jgi:tetratricopeptide (TPR) repeat protein
VAIVRFWREYREATSLRMRGDFAAAERAYLGALAIDPVHEDALYYLGWCLHEQGRPAEARDVLRRLVDANAESARGHLALGTLMSSPEALEVSDLEQAERHLRRAHEINGEETGPMVRLGELLIVRSSAEEALRWLEDAARTNPRSVEAAFLAGYLSWEAGDRPAAAAHYQGAIARAASPAPVHGVLGEGDRKAAPPLEAPMGRMLFGSFSDAIRAAGDGAGGTARPDLDAIYGPVRSRAADLRRRLGASRLSARN